MKVYVDCELPKSCDKCKFYECETELVGEWGIEKHRHICKINGSLIQGICPLQSLTEHDKQVRKEVCEKIREWHDEECESLDLDSDFDVGYSGALSNLWGILDQIEDNN